MSRSTSRSRVVSADRARSRPRALARRSPGRQRAAAGGTGDRLWQAGSIAELRTPYRLAAGTGHLDLSGLVTTDRTARVVASVGAGRLVVTVPQDATVNVHGHAGVGNVEIFGIEDAGLAADRGVTAGGTSPGSLDLDLAVGIGEVVVARASA